MSVGYEKKHFLYPPNYSNSEIRLIRMRRCIIESKRFFERKTNKVECQRTWKEANDG